MARRPDGTVAQARSRAAIVGYLAARAADAAAGEVAGWLAARGIAIRERGLKDALGLRRAPGPPTSENEPPDEVGWIRDAVEFDATKLDLDLAVVIFPGRERPEPLRELLRTTPGVLRVYEGWDRDLVAIIVYDGAQERRRLQTLLDEHEPRLQWIVVREVDDAPASRTWEELAVRIARAEGLLDH